MAAVIAGLVLGISACSKKTSSQDSGMEQNDQTEAQASDEIKSDYAPAPAQAASLGEDIHFDFTFRNHSYCGKHFKSKAQILEKQPDMEATIEGHCDDRGTNEYNMALGDRRAQSTKDFLVQLGIEGNRLSTAATEKKNL